ncbi:MAG: aldehyde dehydrogenase family protein [Candidatus Eisenbacteria bacterium]|nr:aldehyde dehydrogenase family protein [Candidatus Eisenbacteria bacterium]
MMHPITDQDVQELARRVLKQLAESGGMVSGASSGESGGYSTGPSEPMGAVAPGARLGAFDSVDEAVTAANQAQLEFVALSMDKRNAILSHIRKSMRDNAEMLAWMAHQETGLGRFEDKIQKNLLVTNKTPGTEVLVPRAESGDHGLLLEERAPFGTIGAITPTTNPTSTIICNSIGMLAAGNSVVFNVHPNARNVSLTNIHLINEAILAAGGPKNVVTAVANPTQGSAQELMKHKGIRILVVTGGAGVVSAAMQSGKRAICAGPGNPPVVVDETARIEKAGADIVRGASFDNNVICTDEKEVFVVASVADRLKKAMTAAGGYELKSWQQERLMKAIFKETRGPGKPGVINPEFIGKNAGFILNAMGVTASDDPRLLFLEVEADHPLVWTEQMMPVLPVVRVPDADHAIDMAVKAEHRFGHTASMHSLSIDRLSRMAREINTSIFIKNAPNLAGLGFGGEGYTSFTIASPTGEGMTGPIAFSRLRRCTLVDYFRIV